MVRTGNPYLDENLGGFLEGEITLIYGPPASGKTTICLLAASFFSLAGKNIVYMDTEKSFSGERIQQMHKENSQEALKRIRILKANSFEKQYLFTKKLLEESFDLLVIDSLTNHYRHAENRVEANQLMTLHLQDLVYLAREKKVPILCTGQVYTNIDTGNIQIVGGAMIKQWSKCVIRLENDGVRMMELEKHPIFPKKRFAFALINQGVGQA